MAKQSKLSLGSIPTIRIAPAFTSLPMKQRTRIVQEHMSHLMEGMDKFQRKEIHAKLLRQTWDVLTTGIKEPRKYLGKWLEQELKEQTAQQTEMEM